MAITLSGTDGITSPSFVPSSTTAPIVGQYLPSANTIGFVTAGTERLRIDNSGNVGIGTNSPIYKLDVNSGSSTTVARLSSSNTSAYLGITNSGASAFLGSDSSGNFTIQTPGSSYSTKLTVDTSGNIGIGTTPSTKLHISGGYYTEVRVVSSGDLLTGSSSLIRFGGSNSATAAYVGYGGVSNRIDIWNTLNGGIAFGANNSLAMTLDASGLLSLTQGQIKFPATQVPSSDANTLDDYEEGTWTPIYLGNGGSNNPTVSYNYQSGTYVKIGKLVMLSFELSTNSASGGSGYLQIGGFPFSASGTRYLGGLSIGYSSGWSTSGFAPRQGYVYTGWNYAYLTYFTANYNQTELSVSSLAASGGNYVIGHVVYMTS